MLNVKPKNDDFLHGFDVLGRNIVTLKLNWGVMLECVKDHNYELLPASMGLYIDTFLRLDYIEGEAGRFTKTSDSFESLSKIFIDLKDSFSDIAALEYARIFGDDKVNRLEEYENFKRIS